MPPPLILASILFASLAAWWVSSWAGCVGLDEIEPPEGDHYPERRT